MKSNSTEMRRDIKQMSTAQLSSAHLSRKANEYKNETNEKLMNTKRKEVRRAIKQMNTARLSSAQP